MKDYIPGFAEIIQPSYRWKTRHNSSTLGSVALPTKAGDTSATINLPDETNSPLTRLVRLHEMMHAHWTPEAYRYTEKRRAGLGLSNVALQIAEDIRLRHRGEAAELFDIDTYIPRTHIQKIGAQYGSPKQYGSPDQRGTYLIPAMLYCSVQGYPIQGLSRKDSLDFEKFHDATGVHLDKRTKDILKTWRSDVENALKMPVPGKQSLALARATQRALVEIHQQPIPDYKDGTESGQSNRNGGEWLLKMLADTEKQLNGAAIEREMLLAKEENGRQKQPVEGDASYQVIHADPTIWGRMEVVLAPLTRYFRATTKRHGAAAPDGSFPRHWARWFCEKTIWERMGPRPGGTLLIDCSGSMNWSTKATHDLIEALPAMTIAAYNGEAAFGRLAIIARHGRITAPDYNWRGIHLPFGGNCVDGPALEWLAKQAGPRIWFSDGGVSGINDIPRPVHQQEAERICRLGNIRRTKEPEEVIKAFKGHASNAAHHRPIDRFDRSRPDGH